MIKQRTFHRIAAALSWFLLLLFALRSALCEHLHYDGAFNAQAAYNLFASGSFSPDYLPLSFVQTKLPFQLVNGFFLYLFAKHPLSFHLASLLFLAALLALVHCFSYRLRSDALLLAFCCLLLYGPFVQFSISGLGEIPALTLVLLAVYQLLYGNLRLRMYLSGAALGLALSMKWMSFLYLPPFIILFGLLGYRFRGLAKLLLTAACVFMCFTAAHYYRDGFSGFIEQWHGIFNHGLPLFPETLKQQPFNEEAPPYSFFNEKWTSFTRQPSWWLMLFMIAGVCLGCISLLRKRKTKFIAVFLFISSFALTHLVWYWLLSSRSWQRRTIAAEVCAVLAFSLLPGLARKRYLRPLVIGALVLLAGLHVPALYQRNCKCLDGGVLDACADMKGAFNALPPGSEIYASGYFHAPLWNLITGTRYQDALSGNVLFDCLESGCKAYYLTDFVAPAYNEFKNYLRTLYALKEEYRNSSGYRIYRLVDLRSERKEFVPVIDFSSREINKHRTSYRNAALAPTIANWTVANSEQAFFIKTAGTSTILVEYEGDLCHAGSALKLAVRYKGKIFAKEYILQQGKQRIVHHLPKPYGREDTMLYVLEKRLPDAKCTRFQLYEGIRFTQAAALKEELASAGLEEPGR